MNFSERFSVSTPICLRFEDPISIQLFLTKQLFTFTLERYEKCFPLQVEIIIYCSTTVAAGTVADMHCALKNGMPNSNHLARVSRSNIPIFIFANCTRAEWQHCPEFFYRTEWHIYLLCAMHSHALSRRKPWTASKHRSKTNWKNKLYWKMLHQILVGWTCMTREGCEICNLILIFQQCKQVVCTVRNTLRGTHIIAFAIVSATRISQIEFSTNGCLAIVDRQLNRREYQLNCNAFTRTRCLRPVPVAQ